MSRRKRAAVATPLAACAEPALLLPAGAGVAVRGAGRCQAEPWAVGQLATEATLERVRRDSGASQLRPLAPGQATTRDLRPDRLNVFVDASNVIVRIACG